MPDSRQSASGQDNETMSQSLPSTQRAQDAVRNAGRRGTGMVFGVMITLLLVALIFAANQNQIVGWILVVIAGGWLLLATIVVLTFRRGAKKIGDAVDSARAGAAAARSGDAPTVVVDEDTHSRNLKLDHSFKIVQVQVRVVQQELEKGDAADTEMVERALDTMAFTAGNGRDMLDEVVGRAPSANNPSSQQGADTQPGNNDGGHGSGETIEGDVIR